MVHELILTRSIIAYSIGEIRHDKPAIIDESNIHLFEGDFGVVYLMVCDLEEMGFLLREESELSEIRIKRVTNLGVAFLIQD